MHNGQTANPTWEDLARWCHEGSAEEKSVFLSLLLTAIVRENGGFVEISGATLAEMNAEAANGTLLHAIPQTYTDRTHVRLHLPGRSEADDAGMVGV